MQDITQRTTILGSGCLAPLEALKEDDLLLLMLGKHLSFIFYLSLVPANNLE